LSILIGQHEFEGPITNFADVPSAPGIYALLHEDPTGFMLVDIEQSDNLEQSLAESVASLNNQIVVILPCLNGSRRKAILAELVSEFEFEDDEPVVEAQKRRRSEINAGVAYTSEAKRSA